jgi:tetratricopeptide (TPR) repeat protein
LIRISAGCALSGDLAEAERRLAKAYALFQELADRQGLAASLGNQASILRTRGKLDAAMCLFQEQERTFRELEDERGLAASLRNQALILETRGNLDGAMKVLKEADRLCRGVDDKEGLADSLDRQALILWRRGELDEATKLLMEAIPLRIYREQAGITAERLPWQQAGSELDGKGDE